jgi:hypothetical protein
MEPPMTEARPSFFTRLFLAYVAWFRTLFDPGFAAGVIQLRRGALPPPAEPPPKKKKKRLPPPLKEALPDAALQLLAILQREGRFIDFVEEDVSGFSDEEIGAAARVVHDGCAKAIHEHFELAPVRTEDEGAKVKVDRGFDAASLRLTGNVVGEPPFEGTLTHRGWRVGRVTLPKLAEAHDVKVVAPAEVEL